MRSKVRWAIELRLREAELAVLPRGCRWGSLDTYIPRFVYGGFQSVAVVRVLDTHVHTQQDMADACMYVLAKQWPPLNPRPGRVVLVSIRAHRCVPRCGRSCHSSLRCGVIVYRFVSSDILLGCEVGWDCPRALNKWGHGRRAGQPQQRQLSDSNYVHIHVEQRLTLAACLLI